MILENFSADTLKTLLMEIFKKHLDMANFRAFFFGSRITGTCRPTSDIDVGLEGPETIPVSILENIKSEVENLPILYKIDIVDFSSVPKEFNQVVGNNKEYL
ncbi:nucleotidyltransferase domain-containing protein [Candidatus Collierbacteria bacterium]|nr:nucleotidyltransferase domain-containing protein [Candidatus Collierbacteria bacterium]